jgi:mycothiol synthase
VDHYNFRPMSVESRLGWMEHAFYRAEDDLIVVAPDGRIVAFAWCEVNTERNALLGIGEGWLDRVGTRRGFRRLGLGRAIVLAALRRLHAEGLAIAILGVDTANPTGALELYGGVGFRPVQTHVTYAKDV